MPHTGDPRIDKAFRCMLSNIKTTDSTGRPEGPAKNRTVWVQIDRFGAVAQLGERLNGIQEADGSIPFSSTKKDLRGKRPFPFFSGSGKAGRPQVEKRVRGFLSSFSPPKTPQAASSARR